MGKQEFLDKLRLSLNGRVTAETLADTMRYYEEYLNTEVRKGRSEEEVLASLGDPRLIARTIVETKGAETAEASREQEREGEVEKRYLNLPGWVWLVLFLVIAVVILSVVLKILTIMMPVILIILAVSFVVKFFRDRMN